MKAACPQCNVYCRRSEFNLTDSKMCCVCTLATNDCSEQEYRGAACGYCKDRRPCKKEADILKERGNEMHCFIVWDGKNGWKRFISA
mmetsp:Transcript_26196/g.60747  ORF Transcript_26196/g.60747 Transcript_26196/m.60747 type:complete len:87 (+) Transcript_26196:177-437(+)|eukprot:CAMPEP_0114126024 /NCGR_PEP_ID=MMETSP0043_2-20121206/9609_1 /TAXON_ID=464988 /ORGANISM="Hemiselmis andersenii, Strain CCMP644" /LENGTH=86 /DNA_ID=CAMNT_0001218981 /DNA_START=150 /DNA_END=410 /DNA_ORIENTATION=+